jgi:hypothetical protein
VGDADGLRDAPHDGADGDQLEEEVEVGLGELLHAVCDALRA